MKLSINKRFEFSSSHRYNNPGWTDQKNADIFGPENANPLGHGHNYNFFLSCEGPVQSDGMIMELSDLKNIIKTRVLDAYDHHFLNRATAPYTSSVQPSPEALAVNLFSDCSNALSQKPLAVSSVHLVEQPQSKVSFFGGDTVETHVSITFPSLFLTFPWEKQLVSAGTAATLYITYAAAYDPYLKHYEKTQQIHLRLKTWTPPQSDISDPSLLIQNWWDHLKNLCPLVRIKLSHLSGAFWEYEGKDHIRTGFGTTVCASHRLEKKECTEQENMDLFGKCNRLHGHTFFIEPAWIAPLNIQADFLSQQKDIEAILDNVRFKSFSDDIPELNSVLTTCETLIQYLYQKLVPTCPSLTRLRLLETANNRFTLRV